MQSIAIIAYEAQGMDGVVHIYVCALQCFASEDNHFGYGTFNKKSIIMITYLLPVGL